MLSDPCNQGLPSTFGVYSTQSGSRTCGTVRFWAEVKSRWDKLLRRPSVAPFRSKTSDHSIKSAKQRLRKRKRQSGYVGKTPGAPYSRAVVSCGSAMCKAKHSQGKMGRKRMHIKIHSSQNTSPPPPRVLSCYNRERREVGAHSRNPARPG